MKTAATGMLLVAMVVVLAGPLAAQEFVVKVSLDPAIVIAGDPLKIVARTIPDARCSASIVFRAVTWTGAALKTNGDGEVVWSPPTERLPGVFPVRVSCVLGTQKAEGSATLTVRARPGK